MSSSASRRLNWRSKSPWTRPLMPGRSRSRPASAAAVSKRTRASAMSSPSESRIDSNASNSPGRHSSSLLRALRSLQEPGTCELASLSASLRLAMAVISVNIRFRTMACETWNPWPPRSSTNAVTSFASCSRPMSKNSRIWLCNSASLASSSIIAEPDPSSMVKSVGVVRAISDSTIPSLSIGPGSSGSSRTPVNSSTSTASIDA